MRKNVDVMVANALMTQFDKNQIFHDNLPETNNYPMIQYSDINVSPVLMADDELFGFEHDIRVTIVTMGNDKINELKDKVFECMTAAGFVWTGTNKIHDGNEYYTSLDFTIEVWMKE